MKKLKLVAIIGCAFALCLALAGCGGSGSYVGTWDLKSAESVAETENPGIEYTEEQVEALRSSDLDIYLTLKDNGVAVFSNLGALTDGKWEASGGSGKITFDQPGTVNEETGEMQETTEATLKLSGDTLIMEMDNTAWTFVKGEDKDPYGATDGIEVADENGMSLIMTESEKLGSPVTVVDNDQVSLVIDGKGVDAIGDPGYNLQIENKTTDTVNIWLPNPVKVGDKDVRCYTYITLNPGASTTTFLQLDVEDAGTSNVNELSDVTGTIQVDNAENGEVLGSYEFKM